MQAPSPTSRPSSSYLLNLLSSQPDVSPPPSTRVSQVSSPYNPFEEPTSPVPESLKSLVERSAKPPSPNPEDPIIEADSNTPLPAISLIDELLELLKTPRSIQTIQQLLTFARDPRLPIALRIKALLSLPRTVETHSLCMAFAKDETIDINLRTSCALASFACVQKYNLLRICFNTPGLKEDLKIECLLKLVRCYPGNVSQEQLLSYLEPALQKAYGMYLPHPIFMAWFRNQILYDNAMPLLLRAKFSFKPLPLKDHSPILELFANSLALPLHFRVSAAASLPPGPNKDELAKAFMEDPDLETRILWATRLPEREREQQLHSFLADPNLPKDLQYVCALKLKEGELRQGCMRSYAQDESFPLELQASAARKILDKELKEHLLLKFAQREDLSFLFRLPCVLEMPDNALRTGLLQRFAQDPSLDINFRFPCIIALPRDSLKTDLLKQALRDSTLRLSYLKTALRHLPVEDEKLRTIFRAALAFNPLLPPRFRLENVQLLPQSYPCRDQMIASLPKLI